MVSSLLADRFPPDLHLFRNYENPFYRTVAKEDGDMHAPAPRPNGNLSLLWFLSMRLTFSCCYLLMLSHQLSFRTISFC